MFKSDLEPENFGEIDKEVNQTLQTEYNNELNNFGMSLSALYDNSEPEVVGNLYAYIMVLSFEFEDVNYRNRDDIISMIKQKNGLMTTKIRKNVELQKLVTSLKMQESTICVCKNGHSVDCVCTHGHRRDCDFYTVNPECPIRYGRCYGQKWYYYTSLAAGIDLYSIYLFICHTKFHQKNQI